MSDQSEHDTTAPDVYVHFYGGHGEGVVTASLSPKSGHRLYSAVQPDGGNERMTRPPATKTESLTKWEAGNELVKVADALSSAAVELEGWPQYQEIVKLARKLVAETFNAELVDEMGFGI